MARRRSGQVNSGDRIEARVFAALRGVLLTPDLKALFDATLAAERRRLDGDDGKNGVRELRRRRAEILTERGSLLSGAGYHRDFAHSITLDPQMTVGSGGAAPPGGSPAKAGETTQ